MCSTDFVENPGRNHLKKNIVAAETIFPKYPPRSSLHTQTEGTIHNNNGKCQNNQVLVLRCSQQVLVGEEVGERIHAFFISTRNFESRLDGAKVQT